VAEVDYEKPRANAKRMFWRAVTGDWRAWICLAVCGLAGIAGGAYFSWGHGQGGVVLWTTLWAAVGLLVALLLVFLTLWVSAPYRILRAELAALAARVGEEEAAPSAAGRKEQVRVALYAVRSELGACATRIQEAQEYDKWWDPAVDPLPGTEWAKHFAVLTWIPDSLNTAIDLTYKKCDRLNHLARWYMEEMKAANPFFGFKPPRPTELNDYDKEQLNAGLKEIGKTNRAISAHLDSF
jgi:hypothetical protein